MKLSVTAIDRLTPDVLQVTLRHPRHPSLPSPEPGAHVDLHLPDGTVRQYSLCGDPDDASRYTIAVKLERAGRGGSRWLHEHLEAGVVIPVSAPRNHFPLAAQATHHVLVAGGIGITPMAAMARRLARDGASFELHDCARDSTHAPLLETLRASCGPRLHTWFSTGDPPRRLDVERFRDPPVPGAHLYCCGPQGLVAAVISATANWPAGSVHVEHFVPLDDPHFVPAPFEVTLASSGRTLQVPADRTLLSVLREQGVPLPSSCEIGVCGSCECAYRVEGDATVLHRDVVLEAGVRAQRLMPCVSRARGRIVLEL